MTMDRGPHRAVPSDYAALHRASCWYGAVCWDGRYEEPVAAERSRPNPRHMTDPATDEFRPTLRTYYLKSETKTSGSPVPGSSISPL
jgi:hypothetical protein